MDNPMLIHEDEILSDNTGIEYCRQCKKCMFWNGGNAYSNNYQKKFCMIYQFPNGKPNFVVENLDVCEFYEEQK